MAKKIIISRPISAMHKIVGAKLSQIKFNLITAPCNAEILHTLLEFSKYIGL